MFEVQSILLHYMQEVSMYNQTPVPQTTKHTNVPEKTIHFQPSGSNKEAVLDQQIYQELGELQTTYTWWTNEMTPTNQVLLEESVLVTKSSRPAEIVRCDRRKKIVVGVEHMPWKSIYVWKVLENIF